MANVSFMRINPTARMPKLVETTGADIVELSPNRRDIIRLGLRWTLTNCKFEGPGSFGLFPDLVTSSSPFASFHSDIDENCVL